MEENITYVTAEGLEKLKADLEYLRTTKRKEIADRIASAKELGDLSENAEYSDAKEEQSLVEGSILELQEKLRTAQVVSKPKKLSKVVIGVTIEVEDESGKKASYDIVGSNEADPTAGKISNESPLGKAFIGHKVGETVEVSVPKGTVSFKILKIS